ncbi:hypothetical protein I316_02858 [Kwoniella heveanensis BCC8398]|uniref:Phosphodiesterase n=1 Tax=Kwoniella heveanensis BCC8398 TaxID=1296120 RepID=A0A1B9GWA0_9TREE|nr:hypothetical protein I316_02858 [Kwoniella heveanensis BCC8398]
MASHNAANHNPHPSPSLSLLVLMPPSAHWQGLPLPVRRPSAALSQRKSSSVVPSLQSIQASTPITIQKENEVATKAAASGRRLSLASGLGNGPTSRISADPIDPLSDSPTDSPVPPSRTAFESNDRRSAPPPFGSSSSAVTSANSSPNPGSSATSGGPPPFGARRSATTGPRGSKRRPQTATSAGIAASVAPSLMGVGGGRASLAVPTGMGGTSSLARSRPGWEADEVVGNLRGSGLEVTVIRHASHLPALLDPSSSSTFQSAPIVRPSDSSEPLTRVVLVPLSDSPAFPSLSLLLQQGTTPTAVCFQQDLLDRAKRSEEEWLPAALEQIRTIANMRQKGSDPSTSAESAIIPGKPIIIAYSANPAITQTAISACIGAGAAGVLRPPYDLNTADLVMRIVDAYQQGRTLTPSPPPSGARTPSPLSRSRSPGSPTSAPTNVVLPPTALDMGAEHEGEKVLSAAVSSATGHRKSLSGNWNTEPVKRSSISGPPRKQSAASVTASGHLSPPLRSPPISGTGKFDFPPLPQDFPLPSQASFFAALDPVIEPRRRSVDIGGLSLALKRASIALKPTESGSEARREASSGGQPLKPLSLIEEGYTFPPTTPTRAKAQADHISHNHGVEGENVDEEASETELAELLSAMFCHTMTTIEVQMGDYELLSAPLSPEHRERLVNELSTWNFKPHNLPEGDLYRVACLMFESVLHSEELVDMNISRDQINRLLFAIRAIYHAPNPYHNYVHAIDVLQATYMFLAQIGVAPPVSYMREWSEDKPVWKRSDVAGRDISVGTRRAREVMRPQDVLGVLVAAMGHDVGHPGLSNAFMKNAKVPLSQVYEDKSVLENMHCMLIVQLLRKHGFGFLIEGSPAPASPSLDQKGFRRVLYSSVLATDMSLHFAWIQRLKDFDEGLREGEVGEDEYDRVMICQALIKCADISNPTRPIDVSQHWSSVLLEEWAKQASLEQDLDLPVSVVASADAALQAKGQIGFIDLFTLPLFEAVSEALPELQVYADSCADNREIWQRRLDELVVEAAAEEEGDALRRLIQPAVEGASHDDRFKTLFPLLLPTSLLAGGGGQGVVPLITSEGEGISSVPTTPPTPLSATASEHPLRDIPGQSQGSTYAESPDTKAMRAVYRAKIGEPKPRGRVTSSSWARSMGEWSEGRRMSTPEVVVSHGQFA